MLNLLKSNRCSICYTERFVRECPRKKRKICWSCCNNLRCDANCPESCIYSAKSLESNPFPSFKTDSRAEAVDVLKKSIDFWVGRQNPHLDNNSPIKFAENSSKDMLTWLSGYQYPLYFPMAYLMQKLKLPYSQSDDLPNPESFAEQYLDAVIRLAYNELRILTINTNPMDDLSIRYTEILQALPSLKQLTSFSTLHSGISEDGVTALVFVELNHKQDWTVVVSKSTGSWKIRQNIAGSPQAYFAQNNEYTMIAEALGKGDDAKAWELISANLKIYPDSSDLYYYRALYWQLVKQLDKAAVDFFNAAALDDG
ncbi:MAG: hypothetical protein PHO32_00465, partial [Candidatus Cloacimonetes bacterium]|nr:hypothetical protein [Candidatus Cloacimonadota bacterium]